MIERIGNNHYVPSMDKGIWTGPSGERRTAAELYKLFSPNEAGERKFSLEELIEWTDWLGEMGWYKVKSGRWEHDNETGYFQSTTDLINHYLPGIDLGERK